MTFIDSSGEKGRIIIFNGCSSSDKTTIARMLQKK